VIFFLNSCYYNDFNLSVARYFKKEIQGVMLGDIIETIRGQRRDLPEKGKLIRISDLKNGQPEIWKKRVNEILQGEKITPRHSSLNNYFERFQPFKKRLFNRIKRALRRL
jgi:hypothetical protein